jgi:hypothetical protein
MGMSEDDQDKTKYQIEMDQPIGTLIGDHGQFNVHIHAAPPTPPPASREELLSALHEASAELRAYPSDIAGFHILRSETAQIVEWALNAESKERLGMLLDQPGGGKTVVMHDVLQQLEAQEVPTLAIKADTLSSINTRADLAERLGLPAPVEECAHHLAAEGPCIVLLDQLDALSLALSRDQPTLDVMLDTLARLREIEGVRIVASCRTFDLNNDPRLSTIKVDRKFSLRPFDEEQVNQVLHAIGIDPSSLLPAHRELLTVPLHLDVYARVVIADPPGQTPENYRTLQDLYEALWRKRIEVVPPDKPPPSQRSAAIYRLVEVMQNSRRLTAPVGVLDELSEAANYLEHEGFVRREGSHRLFLHQTLFDYCYARRFVAQGQSLTQEILNGPQGLFERSQMVQVLAYLRGLDEQAYLRELTSLFFAADLRVHLRLLLIGWFGALPNPADSELRIARRLVQEADGLAQFLQAIRGNEAWFDLLSDGDLHRLLCTADDNLADAIAHYLSTVIQGRTDAVLACLRPYVGKSERWDSRAALCLSRLEDWQNAEALDLLCDLLSRRRTAGWEDLCFHHLAESNPAGGCRVLRAYLDERLDALLTHVQAERAAAEPDPDAAYRTELPDRFTWERRLFGEHTIDTLMDRAVQVSPEAAVEHLLPWFVRAVMILTDATYGEDLYPIDTLFAWGWYGEHISEGPAFAWRMARALQSFARTQPAGFRAIARQLAAIESMSIHRLLTFGYLADPETYAEDIFAYLTADNRRLNIGDIEDSRYDSGRLYGAAFQHVDSERRAVLEKLVLDYRPSGESLGRGRQGSAQLYFLKSAPLDLLSESARRRLHKLESKFPGFEPGPPQGVVVGWVGPPIERSSQVKMSDEHWLSAMRRYDDSTGWRAHGSDPLKGGAVQLARSFADQVKEDPGRFYHLAQLFDETIALYYISAAISGLADSDAPADWLFDLVRRFAPRVEGEFRRSVCWALEKRAEDGVPDDLLDVMTNWAFHDPDPAEELWSTVAKGSSQPYHGGDPHSRGVNSNRGSAVNAVCRCAWERKPRQTERIFQLLEEMADDPSIAVRTCVIENLGPLLNEDDSRTLAVFEQTMNEHRALLPSPLVHRFLYWTYYHHFERIRPCVEALLASPQEAARQAGARLACLAAFWYVEAEAPAKQVMGCPPQKTGKGLGKYLRVRIQRLLFRMWRAFSLLGGHFVESDPATRRGAAQVYARNLAEQEVEDVCRGRLLQLMHDPDESVRACVGDCFRHLQPDHLNRLQPFIEQFLASPALMDGAHHLLKYLAPLAADTPALALRATECIMDAAGNEVTDIRKASAILERDLARLPLAVYIHTLDLTQKSRAMDLFERLLLMGSRTAHKALSDWDRK